MIILTRAYTHGGWAHRQRVSTPFLTRNNSHNFFLCSWRGRGLNTVCVENNYLSRVSVSLHLGVWVGVRGLFQSRYSTLIKYKVHAGSFRVSRIHRTLTWTTGSLMCLRDHSYACVYTRGGWVHRQRVSTIFLTRKNSHFFLWVRTSGLWISNPTLYTN